MTVETARTRPLLRILGLGFGIAMAFGATVGVGILRLPGTVAAALGDTRLIVLFWVLGGLYALLGAVAVAELATMYPSAGGFYVYARRAFGNGAGFVVGWSDWACCAASIAYAAITATTFLGVLWPTANSHPQLVAVAIVAAFTGLQWIGLRIGRALTGLVSATVGLMLLILIVACFLVMPAGAVLASPPATSAASVPLLSIAMFTAIVAALRPVLVSFDGWYSPIYFAEENTHPARTLPRAIVGGTLLVAALYLVINLAFLRVLPLSVLAASELPAADAARVVLPHGGGVLVTLIALVTVLSLINATLLIAPRILFAVGRAGFFTQKAALVSAGGTPRVALAVTSMTTVLLILSGSFEQLIALAAVLFLLNYLSAYAAVFMLRRRQPAAQRPYRAFGFPVTTAVVLLGSILFLVSAIIDDPRSGLMAALLIGACWPVYSWLARRRGVTIEEPAAVAAPASDGTG
jgi:amino acid transporter